MEGQNPCNICKLDCNEVDCVLNRIHNEVNYCHAYDCMVNYEGGCLMDLYDDCGCRKYVEAEK
jgi:hypothetical protein